MWGKKLIHLCHGDDLVLQECDLSFFLSFLECLKGRINCKSSIWKYSFSYLIVMRSEPESGTVKSVHVLGGLTRTAPCFDSKCLRRKTKKLKHSAFCSVASCTPAVGIFEDANIAPDAIPREKSVKTLKGIT